MPYFQDPEIHTAVRHQHTSDTLLQTTVQWYQVILYTQRIMQNQEHLLAMFFYSDKSNSISSQE